MTRQRYLYVAPRRPDAEPVCLLDREWAARRKEPPDILLADAISERVDANGTEYHFAESPAIWGRLATFIEEEAECCPFFGFERWLEDGQAVLRVFMPEGESR